MSNQAAFKQLWERLVAEGMEPNQAAAEALTRFRAASSEQPPPPTKNLSSSVLLPSTAVASPPPKAASPVSTSDTYCNTMSSFAEPGETKSSTADVINNNHFFKDEFTTPSNRLLNAFNKSVEQCKEGIVMNAYNHYTGDPSSSPACLHWRKSAWKPNKCSDCRATLDQKRLDDEKKFAEKLQEEDRIKSLVQQHNHRIHALGIRVDALLAFAFAHNCWDWTTKRVVRDIIVPATRETRCRYGDLSETSKYFGEATVFASHCWGAIFGELVGSVCHGARKDRFVWIDIFAVRQWPGNRDDLDFRHILERCEAMIVSVSPVVDLMKLNRFGPVFKAEEQAAFLSSEEGIAATEILAFFRLWCIVEISAAVNMKKPIIIKIGQIIQKNRGIYEYKTGNGEEWMLDNIEDMIDIEASKCANQADYDREMFLVYQMNGGANHVNTMVKGVIQGASTSIEHKILEIDTFLCGEHESLLNMKMFSLANENEMKLADKVLDTAVRGDRINIVRLLLEKWNEREEGVNVEREEGEEGEEGEKKNEQKKKKRKRKDYLCHLIGGSNAIGVASYNGHAEIVKMLVAVEGVDINKGVPLSLSCSNGHLEVVKVLLNVKGIDINKKNKFNGMSALDFAKLKDYNEIVQLLVDAGAEQPDIKKEKNKEEESELTTDLQDMVDQGILTCAQAIQMLETPKETI